MLAMQHSFYYLSLPEGSYLAVLPSEVMGKVACSLENQWGCVLLLPMPIFGHGDTFWGEIWQTSSSPACCHWWSLPCHSKTSSIHHWISFAVGLLTESIMPRIPQYPIMPWKL